MAPTGLQVLPLFMFATETHEMETQQIIRNEWFVLIEANVVSSSIPACQTGTQGSTKTVFGPESVRHVSIRQRRQKR